MTYRSLRAALASLGLVAGTLACAETAQTPQAAQRPIKIGFLATLTGPLATPAALRASLSWHRVVSPERGM